MGFNRGFIPAGDRAGQRLRPPGQPVVEAATDQRLGEPRAGSRPRCPHELGCGLFEGHEEVRSDAGRGVVGSRGRLPIPGKGFIPCTLFAIRAATSCGWPGTGDRRRAAGEIRLAVGDCYRRGWAEKLPSVPAPEKGIETGRAAGWPDQGWAFASGADLLETLALLPSGTQSRTMRPARSPRPSALPRSSTRLSTAAAAATGRPDRGR